MEPAPAPVTDPDGGDQVDHDNTGDTSDDAVIDALDSLNIRDTQDGEN